MKLRFLLLPSILLFSGATSIAQTQYSYELNSQLNNTQSRPVLVGGTTSGEIRGVSGSGALNDDGLLRLSAGGGTNVINKSYIELSGYMQNTASDRYRNIIFGTSGVERMRINATGGVSIGTTNATGYMLAVNGNAIFQNVVVKKAGAWPDYVFKPDYQLPSLYEVEQYIKAHGHLEGIPSAETVEQENINLGSMQAQLLKKLEEVTLYLIELKKENDALKQEVEKLKAK